MRPVGAMDHALRLLARRHYTRKELAERLSAKGYEPDETERVLQRLAGWGYLDDLAAARHAVDECLARRPRGRSLLVMELTARGIAECIIDEALAAYPAEKEEEVARRALARLGVRQPAGSRERVRAWRILQRLGFGESTIERLCGIPEA